MAASARRTPPSYGAAPYDALHNDYGARISTEEFDEIMNRNKTISSTAISRAVADASIGDFGAAIETLITAISLIKQTKISHDERCRILISSLEDTLHGIENKSYAYRHERDSNRGRGSSREYGRDRGGDHHRYDHRRSTSPVIRDLRDSNRGGDREYSRYGGRSDQRERSPPRHRDRSRTPSRRGRDRSPLPPSNTSTGAPAGSSSSRPSVKDRLGERPTRGDSNSRRGGDGHRSDRDRDRDRGTEQPRDRGDRGDRDREYNKSDHRSAGSSSTRNNDNNSGSSSNRDRHRSSNNKGTSSVNNGGSTKISPKVSNKA